MAESLKWSASIPEERGRKELPLSLSSLSLLGRKRPLSISRGGGKKGVLLPSAPLLFHLDTGEGFFRVEKGGNKSRSFYFPTFHQKTLPFPRRKKKKKKKGRLLRNPFPPQRGISWKKKAEYLGPFPNELVEREEASFAAESARCFSARAREEISRVLVCGPRTEERFQEKKGRARRAAEKKKNASIAGEKGRENLAVRPLAWSSRGKKSPVGILNK